MRITRLPGFIEILRSPEGEGSGGAAVTPGGGAAGQSAPSAPDSSAAAPSPSSPSGASPAPATPASEAASPTPLPDDPFAGFGAPDLEDDEQPIAKPPVKAQEVQPPPAQPEAPVVPPPAPDAQQASPQGSVPQLPTPAEPQKMSQQLLSNIEELASHISATPEFQLSEADIEAINTDVVTAVPKLLARQYVRSQAAALAQMEKVVPAIIERYMRVSKAREASEGKFYQRWGNLNKAAHGAVVDRLAQTYRRENPSATLEQMVEDLGPIVMMVAKVSPSAAAPVQNGRAPAGGPMASAGGRSPPPSPFQPAVGGPAAPPTQPTDDPWAGYGAASPDE